MSITIDQDVDLTRFNALKTPCHAANLCNVYTAEQARVAVQHALQSSLSILVLGQGTNVVLHDDWPGLVIRQCSSGWDTLKEDDEHVELKVSAGENWHQFVHESLTRGFYGLENLALIPGTMGAAPIQNIGAYGTDFSEFVLDVGYVDLSSGEQKTLTKEACLFSYRDSIFKGELKDRVLITDVTIKLSKLKVFTLEYPALFDYFHDVEPTDIDPWAVFHAVIDIRSSKLPDPAVLPNVGSFFKNPTVNRDKVEELLRVYADMPVYDYGLERFKLPAAWLIERCGWKGRLEEGIGMHELHALVLTNPGGRPGSEILEYARRVADSVYRKFDIALELEPAVYP